jgi:hypothetical protein
MTWKDVTVWQYQQIQNLLSKKDNQTDLDIAVKTLAILTNQTESQIDSLSVKDLNKELLKIKFITEELPTPKPVDFIKIGNRKYRCVYDIKSLPYSRYLETKFFTEDIGNNIHKIAASMILPMKLTWIGWKIDKYDASKHEEYASDMLEAPFESVYGSLVFFCQVFNNSIENLRDFLISGLMQKGMTKEDSEIIVEALCENMDGFTKLQSSQTTKE